MDQAGKCIFEYSLIHLMTPQLQLHHFQNFSAYENIKHFISGRKGGVSTGEAGELNLSFRVDDTEENVRANRSLIAGALSISAEKLVVPAQTHSSNIAEVNESNYKEFFNDTDGFVTNTPGICITVLSADCVPVLLYDPVTHSAAAVHAGWRGTVASIVPAAVNKLRVLYNADPGDIIAGIGPSICGDVYEVGVEVAGAFGILFGDDKTIAAPKANGKFLIDLWEANKRMLLKAGVKEKHIEIAGICTYTNAADYFSARRSGNKAGRFGAGILLL
jgi:YfiH family protein